MRFLAPSLHDESHNSQVLHIPSSPPPQPDIQEKPYLSNSLHSSPPNNPQSLISNVWSISSRYPIALCNRSPNLPLATSTPAGSYSPGICGTLTAINRSVPCSTSRTSVSSIAVKSGSLSLPRCLSAGGDVASNVYAGVPCLGNSQPVHYRAKRELESGKSLMNERLTASSPTPPH